MGFLNIFEFIPDNLKQKWRNMLVDQLSELAKSSNASNVAKTIRKLRSNSDFLEAFEDALKNATNQFVTEYIQIDEDLVLAVASYPEFFENSEIQEAMLAILQKPGAYLEIEKSQIYQSFNSVFPNRINRERVDKAVSFLLRKLAEELWQMPELNSIYRLQFQRLTAEGVREQVVIQKAQLEATNRLGSTIQDALLQLSGSIAEQKLLSVGSSTSHLQKPKVYHNLPQTDYGEFIGREEELSKVFNLLRPYPHSRHHLIVIDGIGGIGKSTLAQEVAHRCLRVSLKSAEEKQNDSATYQTRLRNILVDRFSLDELRTLCFDMALDYDMLPGQGKEAKARELITFMNRRNRLDELVQSINDARPNLEIFSSQNNVTNDDLTFDAIIWTSAKRNQLTADGILTRKQTLKNLDDIYLAIAVALDREDISRSNIANQRSIVNKALTRQRTLLIVDNLETVDDEEVIMFLRNLPVPTKAIVTTRHRIDVSYPIRLEGMPWNDAIDLINDECRKKEIILSAKDSENLFIRTGGVPLALVWCIGQLGLGYPIDFMLTKLAEPINDIVLFCFEEAVALIKGKPAYKLLLALSLAEPDANREFLGFVADLPTLDRDEGLVTLEKLSLLNKTRDRFSLLPLTKDWASNELERNEMLFLSFGRRRIQFLATIPGAENVDYRLRYGQFRSFEEGENILTALEWAYEHGTAENVFSLMPQVIDYLDGSGRWPFLFEILERAINLAHTTNNAMFSARLNDSMGWLHIQVGDFDQAYRVLNASLQRYSETNNLEGQASILQRLSGVARKTGEFEKAHEYMAQAHEIATKVGDGDLMALINTSFGKLARDEEQWELSWEYFQKVQKWFEKRTMETPRDEDLAYGTGGHLAIAAYHLGRPEEAKELCLRSLDFFERVGTKGYLATLNYRMALAEEALGNLQSALEYADASLHWVDRLNMKPDYPKTKQLYDQLTDKLSEA